MKNIWTHLVPHTAAALMLKPPVCVFVCVSVAQFSGVIGFIFFLELTAAVLAVVFQSQVREWINEFFLANVKAYRDDIDLQNLIDSLQRMVTQLSHNSVTQH